MVPAHKNKGIAAHFFVFELQACRLSAGVAALYFVHNIFEYALIDNSEQIKNAGKTLLTVNRQQFNLKHQRRIWRYHAASAALPIGNC